MLNLLSTDKKKNSCGLFWTSTSLKFENLVQSTSDLCMFQSVMLELCFFFFIFVEAL